MVSIQKRLAKLERSAPTSTATKKITIIGTAIIATDDTALHGTHSTVDSVVTFYAATLADAYTLREKYLSEQKDVVALVAPMDTGDRALEVLAERHGTAWLDDVEASPEDAQTLKTMTEAQLVKLALSGD